MRNIGGGGAEKPLEAPGCGLSRSQKFDVVIVYCIKKKNCNLVEVNKEVVGGGVKIFRLGQGVLWGGGAHPMVRAFFRFRHKCQFGVDQSNGLR